MRERGMSWLFDDRCYLFCRQLFSLQLAFQPPIRVIMPIRINQWPAGTFQMVELPLLHRFADSVLGNDGNRSDHFFVTSVRIASTKPGTVCTFASVATSNPFSRAACDVCGPILANLI